MGVDNFLALPTILYIIGSVGIESYFITLALYLSFHEYLQSVRGAREQEIYVYSIRRKW